MRVGIYARVSTHDQHTLGMQMTALKEYVQLRHWSLACEYAEVGSGVKERTKRLDLLNKARTRQIDIILVWKLDRWGRSVHDLFHTLQELHVLGVGFVSLTESLDLTTPTGRAMAGLLAIFSEFERDLLKERVTAGIAYARSQGGLHGRPPTTIQYTEDVLQMHAQGFSQVAISQALRISRASVQRILKR